MWGELSWGEFSLGRVVLGRAVFGASCPDPTPPIPPPQLWNESSISSIDTNFAEYFDWKHISNIFSFETESPDPNSPRKNEKAKKFWSFVKSLKNDAFGINTLRENGILKTDTLDKANICNRQFQTAFTRESDDEIPSKGTSPFTPMGEITVDPNGGPQTVEQIENS